MARLKATTGDDLLVREAMLNTIPGKTPTKTYDNRSTAGNTCRFCSVPLVSETGKRSSSVPIFSATQREEHKGAKICEVLSQLGIDVQELEFKSKRCCQKCARQIFSSYKFLSDLKRNLYEERISSVKRLASGSPSVSVKDPNRGDGEKVKLARQEGQENSIIPGTLKRHSGGSDEKFYGLPD